MLSANSSFPAIIVLAVTLLPLPARAVLGGDAKSVQDDQARMRGSLRITQVAAYSVHEIQSASGMRIREYVSDEGKVFAVGFQGFRVPDMRLLLGQYFPQYQRAALVRRSGHGPLLIEEPGLVVQIAGHMRAFVGRAYVPHMIPEGVRVQSIR